MRTKIKQKKSQDKTMQTNTINQVNLRNLKEMDTTNKDGQQQTSKFWFSTVNTRPIQPREDIILKALNEYKINLLVTRQTWIKNIEDDQQWLQGSELNRNDFQTLPINRKTRKGVGIALTVKKTTL